MFSHLALCIRNTFYNLLYDYKRIWIIGSFLLLFEVLLSCFIVQKINYTEIDWIAYMQEVEGYLNGTYDYMKLGGQTGYLPYPAAFVYLYSALYYCTNFGVNIKRAQYIFVGFYILNLFFVFHIYRKVSVVPPYVLVFMCASSYRIHSIFMLRLFNDPLAMLLLYVAVNFFISDRWSLGCIFFSMAVGIKMNVMLCSPGLLIVLLLRHGLWETLGHLAECFSVQIILGLPFLSRYAVSYFVRAFEFSRQFLFKWTVNWRFLPLEIFQSRIFHSSLLFGQLVFIFLAFHVFLSSRGGWSVLLRFSSKRYLSANEVVYPIFLSNFLGVMFGRSLHYQFYSWYFHTLHYLFWCTSLSSPFRLLLLGIVELCWNVYPSSNLSSAGLHLCHIVLLGALLISMFVAKGTNYPPKSRSHEKREPCLLEMWSLWWKTKKKDNYQDAPRVTRRGFKILQSAAAAATTKSC